MTAKETQERLLTPEEVAGRLNVSLVTVGRWLREGKLKGVKAGRQWRIKENDLQEFLLPPPADEYQDGYPVIPCRREGSTLIFLKPCPYCGRKHTHGAGNPPYSSPPWNAGHRASHCPDEVKGRRYARVSPEAQRGYILKVVEEQEHTNP